MNYIKYQVIGGAIYEGAYDGRTTEINLNFKSICKIVEIKGLKSLQILRLSNNMIAKIEGLDSLTSLQILTLSNNQITKIEGLDSLTSLQILYLNNNQITQIGGLDSLASLQILELNNNQITQIVGLGCLRLLQELYLYGNKIAKIEGLNNLISLKKLNLSDNKITKIEELGCLGLLQGLYLYGNQITKVEGLSNLISLRILSLSSNRIAKIEGLGCLGLLQELYLSYNEITQMEGLSSLTSLQLLNLNHNSITKIGELDSLTSLQVLYLPGNNIIQIPIHIVNLRSLEHLRCDIPLDPIIERFLNGNRIKSRRTIYDDKQNVHDNHINRSITESLYRLLDEKVNCTDQEVLDGIVSDNVLSQQSKEALIEYSMIPDVHSQLNVTFMEAIKCVWTTICKHKQSSEIKRVLDQEIRDSICKCFTGRLSRLVNTLSGFDDRVLVRISDQQEISNVIVLIKQRTTDLMEQQKMITNELSERGYDKQTVNEWLAYLE
jgi:Leucine-rich repeat (LRR) protein